MLRANETPETKFLRTALRIAFVQANFDRGDIPLMVERIVRDDVAPKSVFGMGPHLIFDFARTLNKSSDLGRLISERRTAVRNSPKLIFQNFKPD